MTDGLRAPDKQRLRQFTAPSARRSGFGIGYTWFVRVARLALPLVAIVLVGIVIARLAMDKEQTTASLTSLPKDEKNIPGETELVEARYEGRDDKNQPFTVQAEQATRDMTAPDVVLLTKPGASLSLMEGAFISFTANKGSYDTRTSKLLLSDNVVITHDAGYTLRLNDIDIDAKTRNATTANAVSGNGPLGRLTAAGMDVQNGGELIIFKGPATLRLQRAAKAEGKPG